MASNKYKYGIVILHYIAYDMTKECIDTLISNYSNNPIVVAIVDNASSNNSGRRLKEDYDVIPNVHVIINEINEGFAKGNNIGYRFLRERYDLEYIIVMNNDVVINQHDFFETINVIYAESQFAVLGPDIINPLTGVHQSPSHIHAFTREEVLAQKSHLEKHDRYFTFYYFKHEFGEWIKKILGRKSEQTRIKLHEEEIVNPVLQGACYIFSREFINYRENAFCPDTFLYYEEDILHAECIKLSLKIVYSPKLQVYHMEDVATNMKYRSKYKREKMKNSEMLRSVDVLLGVIP